MRLREEFCREQSRETRKLSAMSKALNVIRSTNLLKAISHSFLEKKEKDKKRSFSTIFLMLMESEGNSKLEPYHYFSNRTS